jgi:hypothetical protein
MIFLFRKDIVLRMHRGEATAMTNYHDEMHDDRFMLLEIKATQIRKLLLGSLLLAKDAWKDALLGTPEGLRVLRTVEEAAEEFIDPSITDPVAKLDNILGVINRRARAVVVVMDYIARLAPPKTQGTRPHNHPQGDR